MDYNPFSLAGKTVLVTGASSGIGRATAIECSRMGARVVLSARSESRLGETLSLMEGDTHQVVVGDLTQADDLDRLVGFVDNLDGLVLCAGRGMTAPFIFSGREKFDAVFDVNFFAPVELLRLMVKKKKLNKTASVVFVSSVAGNTSFNIGNDVYGASKAALNSMMRFCAKELAAKKIRVNSINPGMVNTQLIQDGAITEDQYKLDMEKYPLKRYGNPAEIAYGIVYLLSEAAAWVTGTSLVIDGGYTI